MTWQMNKRTLIGVVVLGATALTGCSNKTDANEKNFGAAMAQYLDQKGAQCLGLSSWPVDVTEYNVSKGLHDAPAMAALESVGLVHGVDAEIQKPDPFGTRRVRVKRYTLTELSKPFVREWEARTIPLDGGPSIVKEADLCWGRTRTVISNSPTCGRLNSPRQDGQIMNRPSHKQQAWWRLL